MLATAPWVVRNLDGSTRTFYGKYLICDGGYLRWPCLVCAVDDKSDPALVALGSVIPAVRKDVECVFGSLKKRFKWLKCWSSLKSQKKIDNVFITCCILHNMLLDHDGYLDEDVTPGCEALAAIALKNTGCLPDLMWAQQSQENVADDEPDSWLVRLVAIGTHILATRQMVHEMV